MRKYLKALFRGQSPDDMCMFVFTGGLVTVAVLLSPLWVPFYIVGRTAVYLYAKEYE